MYGAENSLDLSRFLPRLLIHHPYECTVKRCCCKPLSWACLMAALTSEVRVHWLPASEVVVIGGHAAYAGVRHSVKLNEACSRQGASMGSFQMVMPLQLAALIRAGCWMVVDVLMASRGSTQHLDAPRSAPLTTLAASALPSRSSSTCEHF